MEFETVQIGNAYYIKKNDVMSTAFAQYVDGDWYMFVPVGNQKRKTKAQALRLIDKLMDTWYTAQEAAAWLVENGVFDKVSAHDVCLWARNGLLPGAVKITGKGGAGQGGSWRIPEAALVALAQRRRGQ